MANVKSTSHRCYLFKVAFVWELIEETIHLPLGCLQGGVQSGFNTPWSAPCCPLCQQSSVSLSLAFSLSYSLAESSVSLSLSPSLSLTLSLSRSLLLSHLLSVSPSLSLSLSRSLSPSLSRSLSRSRAAAHASLWLFRHHVRIPCRCGGELRYSSTWTPQRGCTGQGNTGTEACSTHAPGMRPGILTHQPNACHTANIHYGLNAPPENEKMLPVKACEPS